MEDVIELTPRVYLWTSKNHHNIALLRSPHIQGNRALWKQMA